MTRRARNAETRKAFEAARKFGVAARHANKLQHLRRNTMTAPTLDGYVTEDDGINVCVWCEHCTRWHYHGHHCGGSDECSFTGVPFTRCTCPLGTGNGHRVAHCGNPASPYSDTGYVIHEVGYKPRAELRDTQDQNE